MRAISLWQPWASAIAAGVKTIETRSWATPYRGPLAIHAAKRWTAAEEAFWVEHVFDDPKSPNSEAFSRLGIHSCAQLPFGAIVATCELFGCLSTSSHPDATDAMLLQAQPKGEDEESWGNYSEGRFAWLLRNVKAITPVPCTGRQGFFDWTPISPAAAKE